jgi:hypothetical protein
MDKNKLNELALYSNYKMAKQNAKSYLGPDTELLPSTRTNKKFMILNPSTNKYVHFGQMGYQDYTYHGDEDRRYKYLRRALHIKGDWMNNQYSPNNLSMFILWMLDMDMRFKIH